MKLKLKIDKAAYDGLHEELKKLYFGDGTNFELNVETVPHDEADIAPLKRALERERQLHKDAADKITSMQTEMDELKSKGGTQKIDVIEKAWQEKYNNQTAAHTATVEKLTSQLKTSLKKNVVDELLKPFDEKHRELIRPHIDRKVDVEFDTDLKPKHVFLNDANENSFMTKEEFGKKLIGDEKFSPFIIAGNGSGGGAAGSGKGAGSGAAGVKSLKDFKSASEEAAFERTNPAEYQKLLQAAQENQK